MSNRTRSSALLLVALVASACATPALPQAEPPPTAVAAAAPASAATAPAPVAGPTVQPGPPTPPIAPIAPTPVPRVPLRIGVQLVPAQPQAGQEFVLRLMVSNDGDRIGHGVYIATSGPWDRYTVTSVEPSGRVARDAAGWHIISPVDVPPKGSATIEIRAQSQEPGDEQLTFAIREADPGELP